MLSLALPVEIYFCTQPTDMRRGFDGLLRMAEEHLSRDVLRGGLYVFVNRRRDRLKLLYWDNDGLAIWHKKLEQHYPHCFPFTGIGEVTDNRARRPTTGGGMDSSSARTGPRRRPMPREIAVIAPPRAQLSAGA